MGLTTKRKNFTEWETENINRSFSFLDVWELGKEKYRNSKQNLIGVYLIKNIKTDKIYIGSSHHILGRLKSHASNMKAKKHNYLEINNDFIAYGEESFIFEIITYCNRSELKRFEKSWLETYNKEKTLYNKLELDQWNTPRGRWNRKQYS
jgi:predicted GIY-YIG superfamily endonuclease